MKPVRHQRSLENGRVLCFTCGHRCTIAEGARGRCGVMENRGGVLVSLVYGRAVAMHVDPIEKKPFFHFLPGAEALSVATVGCNLTCLNCQNADISQMPRDAGRIEGADTPPEAIVGAAEESRIPVIAYTYTEPAVFFDYALDTALLAAKKGIRNVFVTNGFLSEESIRAAVPVLDAANVDLKAFNDDTYRRVCGARLEPVLDAIRLLHGLGVWIEITTLVIPGLNDSDAELGAIAEFIRSVHPGIPWHVSRFYPQYRMTDRQATPVETIRRARAIGMKAGLRYVYAGNVPGDGGEDTMCPECGIQLVERTGFRVLSNRIREGRCSGCGGAIYGVW
jgi:pyruvate formate lyase activating enzyme